MKRLLIAAASSLLWVGSAHAQTCAGGISFKAAPLQAGAEGAFSSNSRTFLGGVGGGNDMFFVRGAAEIVSLTDLDSAKGVLGNVGAEYKVDSGQRTFSVCPMVTVVKLWGPSIGLGIDTSTLLLQVGGSVGIVAGKAG